MKNFTKLFLLLALFFITEFSFGQGINFETKSYAETVEAAKSTGKMIMLDFYTDWCVPCKQMNERIFTEKRVGDVMNDSFLILRIDAEKGEGVELAKRFSVTGYPTLIFLNSDNTEKYRLRGAPLNVNLFLEMINVVKGKEINLNEIYDAYLIAEPADKLVKAQQIVSLGPAQYALMTGNEHLNLRAKVQEVVKFYFEAKPVSDMINETDFDIISLFLGGATNELPQIEFLYKNYNKFKDVVPEIDLATFVVKVNNESIQKYSRDGDLIWKKFVAYIDNELKSAYTLLGEKNPREIMSCVANINSALYVEKDFDRYISLRDKYSKLLKDSGEEMKGNYFYAAQILYRQSDGKLSEKQINKAIAWLNLNVEEGFNLPATYLLLGDYYALLPDKKAEAIYNYNRCANEAAKQGENVNNRYRKIVTTKINEVKMK